MLVIQELYTDSAEYAVMDLHGKEQYPLSVLTDHGFTTNEDHEVEITNVLNAFIAASKDRMLPKPCFHSPVDISIELPDGTKYTGNVTESGNVFVLQTRVCDDEIYQCIAYFGARGRYQIELEWIFNNISVQNPEEYKTIYDLFKDVEPVRYETSGPKDIVHYENALDYALRKYEAGDNQYVTYWLKDAVANLNIMEPLAATSSSILSYLSESKPGFTKEWEALVDIIESTRKDTLDFCYKV